MACEISVVRAKPGSRETKNNEIGVEFEVKLSDEEVFESVFMRKVDNGTIVLEVTPPHTNPDKCWSIRSW
jgi:hypothetical protein